MKRTIIVALLFFGSIAICNSGRAAMLNGDVGQQGDDPALVVNSGWNFFSWDGDGVDPVFNNEGAFTFTVPSGSQYELIVTDSGVDGDQFTVYNYGSPLFTTSNPLNDGQVITDDDPAFASMAFSHGTEVLGPGNYSISLQTIAYADGYNGGGAGIQLESVPEPSALALLVVGGVSSIVVVMRRRIK